MNGSEGLRISRRAFRIEKGMRDSRPLSEWQLLDAYALLGDPGAGKTFAFQDEAARSSGQYLLASDIELVDPAPGVDLYIDGLDQIRAGDQRFEALRKRLKELGKPRFRVSCREADWRKGDGSALALLSPDGNVAELHLEPLKDDEIRRLVCQRMEDPDDFLRRIRELGLAEMLGNPLMLEMLVDVASEALPTTRFDLYERACQKMAAEHNDGHIPSDPYFRSDDVLSDASRLCALLLLAARDGVSLSNPTNNTLSLSELPTEFRLTHALTACKSKLFSWHDGIYVPRHRSIAEFLAGRALHVGIESGLPLDRALALMQGHDGLPVSALRGTWAWLAIHNLSARRRLVRADPLGVVLNGDVAAFTPQERIDLLDALLEASKRDPWMMSQVWVQQPFAPLAIPEMEDAIGAHLRNLPRNAIYGSFARCLFSALKTGRKLPGLAVELVPWIEDSTLPGHLRADAFEAWWTCSGNDVAQARRWLGAIQAGSLPDNDDELCGEMLMHMYPWHLSPSEVVAVWHEPRSSHFFGNYDRFWRSTIWERTLSGCDQLINSWMHFSKTNDGDNDAALAQDVRERLLLEATVYHGEEVDDDVLYRWLGIDLGIGAWRTRQSDNLVAKWLSARPERMLGLLRTGLANGDHFWHVESRLHGAVRPRRWYYWLLDLAAESPTAESAQNLFSQVAWAAIQPPDGFDVPCMEEVEGWVDSNQDQWPGAQDWLRNAWSFPIDHWRSEDFERQRRADEKHELERNQRRQTIAPHLDGLLDGTAPPDLLCNIAIAHEIGFSNLRATEPIERVRELLVTDLDTVASILTGFRLVLNRSDLPSPEDAIDSHLRRRHFFLQPAALFAAKLAFEHDPHAPLNWSRPLVERLVAYYLCDGVSQPDWYAILVRYRADWVAPVLVKYASAKFKHRGQESSHYVGIWQLADESSRELARQCLPQLLEAIPRDASADHWRALNALLAALPSLPDAEAANLVADRLTGTLDTAQRIAWLVADLPYRANSAAALVAIVGQSDELATYLTGALSDQPALTSLDHLTQATVLHHIIHVLAPLTKFVPVQEGEVVDVHRRSDTVQRLFAALARNPTGEALTALRLFEGDAAMALWWPEIRYRIREQIELSRESLYRTPSLEQVIRTLSNSAPSNASDLRALVVDHLNVIEGDLRGESTFALKAFWRQAHQKRDPIVENDCRDLLLERLNLRLRTKQVHVEREQSKAQEKRVDMCAVTMCGGKKITLPIEVKKEDHPELWTAWREQLDKLYTNDPACLGYGLYLVLWFGHKPKPTGEGHTAKSRDELKSLLEEQISTEDRHRLAVHVMDLSWPV